MNIRNFILPLVLLFFAEFCIAQNDSLPKKENVSLFTSYQVKSSIVFSDSRYNYFTHKLYDHKVIRYPNSYHPDFIISPGLTFSDNYSKFNTRNIYYNYYNPSYSYTYPSTNPWVDPTNPWSTNKPCEVLILGSVNYLFSKIFQDK